MTHPDTQPGRGWFRWAISDRQALITWALVGFAVLWVVSAGAQYFAQSGNLLALAFTLAFAQLGILASCFAFAILLVQYPGILPDPLEAEL